MKRIVTSDNSPIDTDALRKIVILCRKMSIEGYDLNFLELAANGQECDMSRVVFELQSISSELSQLGHDETLVTISDASIELASTLLNSCKNSKAA